MDKLPGAQSWLPMHPVCAHCATLISMKYSLGCPAPFNAGNRQIMFVHRYCYLGCVINDELSIINEYKAVYRKAERKVYMLGKLRFFVDKNTALLIYKQAVLPYFDYGVFFY